MAKWGKQWLAGGYMQARFTKPVYDGDTATVTSTETPEGLDLTIFARGDLCANGSARLAGSAAPRQRLAEATMPGMDQRPAASVTSLPVGRTLGTLRETYLRAEGLAHIEAVRDDPGLYEKGRIANAAWLLRRANYVLADNVKLGPWIHVESAINLHSLLQDGEDLAVRAVVADNVETKGHLMVVLDVQMLAGERMIMSCRHWAIYEPRQVRQAR
jgi:hypothetical protein